MFVFEYINDDYSCLLKEMARQLNVPLKDQKLFFPPEIAKGYFHLLTLPNQLQVILSNCELTCDWYLHRKAASKQFYVLHYDEFTIPDKLVVSIAGEEQTRDSNNRSIIFLTSSMFDFSYLGTKGTIARGINILIKPEWITNYLGLESVEVLFKNYIALKAQSLNRQLVDNEYMNLMNDIMRADESNSFSNLYLVNRLQMLIERFFTQLYKNTQTLGVNVNLNNEDISRLMVAEQLLTEDYSEKPPSINELAKISSMSPTKFKINFKLVYGQPVYSYYQHQRLKKAREYLVSGKYKVKGVAEALGFYNLSNFISAFKKHFDILPSEIQLA